MQNPETLHHEPRRRSDELHELGRRLRGEKNPRNTHRTAGENRQGEHRGTDCRTNGRPRLHSLVGGKPDATDTALALPVPAGRNRNRVHRRREVRAEKGRHGQRPPLRMVGVWHLA